MFDAIRPKKIVYNQLSNPQLKEIEKDHKKSISIVQDEQSLIYLFFFQFSIIFTSGFNRYSLKPFLNYSQLPKVFTKYFSTQNHSQHETLIPFRRVSHINTILWPVSFYNPVFIKIKNGNDLNQLTNSIKKKKESTYWPHSLVCRIFKARYFPHVSYLTARIGHNPSYIWRSILRARFLVKGGSRWCIGPGNSIPILDEPWLVNGNCIRGNIPGAHFVRSSTVADLLDTSSKVWNVSVVSQVFSYDIAT